VSKKFRKSRLSKTFVFDNEFSFYMLIPEKRPDYGIILNKKIDLWKK
jgi:hypothetical protein